jgi:hypothetical protein
MKAKKEGRKPTIYIESGKKATAIAGYPKKQLPHVAKDVVKRQLAKGK